MQQQLCIILKHTKHQKKNSSLTRPTRVTKISTEKTLYNYCLNIGVYLLHYVNDFYNK